MSNLIATVTTDVHTVRPKACHLLIINDCENIVAGQFILLAD